MQKISLIFFKNIKKIEKIKILLIKIILKHEGTISSGLIKNFNKDLFKIEKI